MDVRRNIENSEFNVARHYEFKDTIFFAAECTCTGRCGCGSRVYFWKAGRTCQQCAALGNKEFGSFLPGRLEAIPSFDPEPGYAVRHLRPP